MEFLFGMCVGVVVAFFYWRAVILKAIEQALEHVAQAGDNLDSDRCMTVNVEQEGSVFLLYQADTNKFIMQGTDLQDFQERLRGVNVDQLIIKNTQSPAALALIQASQEKS